MECPICRESNGRFITLPCHPTHSFHRECLAEWVKKNPTCPNCRKPVAINILVQEISQSAKRWCHVKVWLEPIRWGFYAGLMYFRLVYEAKKMGAVFFFTDFSCLFLLNVVFTNARWTGLFSKSISFAMLQQADWLDWKDLRVIGLTTAISFVGERLAMIGQNLDLDHKAYYERLRKPSLQIRVAIGFLAMVGGCILGNKAALFVDRFL